MSDEKKPTSPCSNDGNKPVNNTIEKCTVLKSWRKKHKSVIEQALKDQKKMLEAKKRELERWNDSDKAKFKKWFGTTKKEDREMMQKRIDKMLELNKKTTINNFYPPEEGEQDDDTYAYVYPNDKKHSIYLDKQFHEASATGEDSKAGTLSHEMSHFNDIGGTKDHEYGSEDCKESAKTNPNDAKENADTFQYYLEGIE